MHRKRANSVSGVVKQVIESQARLKMQFFKSEGLTCLEKWPIPPYLCLFPGKKR